jgi:stage III sporulation protein AA
MQRALQMLPVDVRDVLLTHARRGDLLEVVLDLGRCPEARFANAPNQCLRAEPVTRGDLDAAIDSIGDFGGDNRAGIQGTLHRISAIRNRNGSVVGLTCRVGRALKGHVDMIEDLLAEGGESILFLGRPGVGKTTVIRELARVLSDVYGKRVVIIDTSNEIGGDGDVPHPAIGGARRMQVPDPSQQHRVMIEAVENHTPEIIIVDEIGTEEEAAACRTIAERGVTLIGTAHGQLLENLIKNPTLSDLVGGVQSVTLGDDEARARGCQKTIMERQAPPTFPILIEMHERDFWVAHNVEESVDEVLAGGRPVVQMRRRDEATGEVMMDRCVYDAEVAAQRESMSYTLGSMGGVMAPTASMDSGMFDKAQKETRGNAEEEKAANAISFSPAAQSNNAVHRVPLESPVNGGGRAGQTRRHKSLTSASSSYDENDPYAWALSIGSVPDKDALEAMGAGGYIAGGRLGGQNDGNGNKTGNGKKAKKVKRLRARAESAKTRGGGC